MLRRWAVGGLKVRDDPRAPSKTISEAFTTHTLLQKLGNSLKRQTVHYGHGVLFQVIGATRHVLRSRHVRNIIHGYM